MELVLHHHHGRRRHRHYRQYHQHHHRCQHQRFHHQDGNFSFGDRLTTYFSPQFELVRRDGDNHDLAFSILGTNFGT